MNKNPPYLREASGLTLETGLTSASLPYKQRVNAYLSIPAFAYTTHWLGAPYCVRRFLYTLDLPLSLPQKITPPASVNFVAVLAWSDGSAFLQRRKLWDEEDFVLYEDDYNKSQLPSTFFIEIWTLPDEATATNEAPLLIPTSLTTAPTSDCFTDDGQTLPLTPTEVYDNVIDLLGTVCSGVDGDYWTFGPTYEGTFSDLPTIVPVVSTFEDDFESYDVGPDLNGKNGGTGWNSPWLANVGEVAGTVSNEFSDSFIFLPSAMRSLVNTTWDKMLIGIRISGSDYRVTGELFTFGISALSGAPYTVSANEYVGVWVNVISGGLTTHTVSYRVASKDGGAATNLTQTAGGTANSVIEAQEPGQVVFFEIDKTNNKFRLAVNSFGASAAISDVDFEAIVDAEDIFEAENYSDYEVREFTLGATEQSWYSNLEYLQLSTFGGTGLHIWKVYGTLI